MNRSNRSRIDLATAEPPFRLVGVRCGWRSSAGSRRHYTRQRGFVFGIWGYVAAAIAVLALIAGIITWADKNIATSAGVKKGEAKIQANWDEAKAQQREKEKAQVGKAAEKLEVKREKTKVIYRTITKAVDRVVERPVYRAQCLDEEGLRLANAAIRGVLTESPNRNEGSKEKLTLKMSDQIATSSGS